MKNKIFVLILLLGSVAMAQGKQTRFLGFDNGTKGVGLLLGKPTGFRYSYWLNWRRALYFDAGYDFDGVVLAQGSYSFYFYDAKDQWKKNKGFNSFLFYLAPGISTGFRVKGQDQASSFVLGGRGAAGLEYLFGRGEWAIRGEIATTLNFVGRTFLSLQGFVGATYYFDSKSKKEKSTDKDYDKELDDEFN